MTLKVKFRHEFFETEPIFSDEDGDEKPQRIYTGTGCRILDSETELAYGYAKLSHHDQFSRVYGRSLAFYRAMDLIEDKAVRTEIYNLIKSQGTKLLPKSQVVKPKLSLAESKTIVYPVFINYE